MLASRSRGMKVAILLALLGTAAACGGTTQGGGFGEGDDAGPSGHVPFLAQDSGAPRGAGVHDASVSDAGTPDTSAFDATASDDSSIEVDSGSQVDTGAAVTSADGFGPSRTACINKINALRATDTAVALQPYTLQPQKRLSICFAPFAPSKLHSESDVFEDRLPWQQSVLLEHVRGAPVDTD